MDEILGIVSRRYCEDSDTHSDIATIAAFRALQDAAIEPREVDAIIYCGITGGNTEPGTAPVIQSNLGAFNAVCTDVTNACHGFCDGLFFGDLLIKGGAEHVLVVTAELSRVARSALAEIQRARRFSELEKMLGGLTVGDSAGAFILGADEIGRAHV